jgi:hypothetical protein
MMAAQLFVAINVIYFLGLGIAARCLYALGSNGVKPWRMVFPKRKLWLITLASHWSWPTR